MSKAWMVAVALAGCASTAVAEDFGFYAFGSLGVARIKLDDSVAVGGSAGQVSSSTSDNPTAIKLQLGYQFDANWAIEGGYTHVQDLKYDAIRRAGSTNQGISAADSLSIWNAVAALTMPLGTSNLYGTGRIGVASVREEYVFSVGGIGFPVAEDSKTGLTYGIGLKYNLNPNFSVRADLDHYEAKNDDFNVWSVGAGYKF